MSVKQPALGKPQPRHRRDAGARAASKGFWHRPDWMNLVSDVLLVMSSVLLTFAVLKVAVSMPLFGLREVVIVSPLSHVTTAQLEYVAESALGGNFFTVDLEKARSAFENLPWVRSAQLRRVWPGGVEVSLEEHVAVAYWSNAESGDTQLVNSFGELFDAAANDSMPVLSGPVESSRFMLQKMRRFNDLLQPINRKVLAASLSGRQAWQLKLDDGMVVELGKEQSRAPLEERLSRFVGLWPQLSDTLTRPVKVADLRYQSGFAVRMAGSEQGNRTQ